MFLILLLSLLLKPASLQANNQDLAISKAQEAFYIQSGLKSEYDKLQSYFKYQINNSGYNTELLIITESYIIFRNKTITIPINKCDKLSINLNSIGWSHEIY